MASEIFMVIRIIESEHQSAMEACIGVFEDVEGAKGFLATAATGLKEVVEYDVTSNGKPVMGMTVGSVLQGLGIGAIKHRIDKIGVQTGSQILTAGGRIVAPN